ncbi:hypothetical protein F5Y14DRAFT_407514 [Nemania sp. NC0429]|nr:hypothetical protein F5Y14DRAFT_407514 [Nemania sp. NC0429]
MVRCDKKRPCSNCVKAGVGCRVGIPQPSRPKKKRIPEHDLIDRLRRYEVLLLQNSVEFEPLGPGIEVDESGPVEESD